MPSKRRDGAVQFGDTGIATAYVSLPIGSFEREARLAELTAKTHAPEVLYLTGQADLALRLELNDFRSVLRVPYPSRRSKAATFNWIFSVPYQFANNQLPGKALPVTAEEAHASSDEVPIRFFVHLRLRRSIYAQRRLEADVLNLLSDLMERHHLRGTLQAGLGWSDVVIDASVTPDHGRELVDFLLELHELRVAIEGRAEAILQRTLTLFGYRWPQVPHAPPLPHRTFVRSMPGHLSRAFQSIRSSLTETDTRIRVIDGKADLLAESHGNVESDFFKRQLELRETKPSVTGIQRLETHFVLLDNPLDARLGIISGEVAGTACSCASTLWAATNAKTLKTLMTSLPQELREAVSNVLFLFMSALKDPLTCCDVRPAVRGCEAALLSILTRVAKLSSHAKGDMTEAAAVTLDAQIKSLYKKIEKWQHFAERTLRQRTVGSFEEIFGQTDRALAYRGSVQKFLYLADSLVNDFAKQVTETTQPPSRRHRTVTPAFTTLYDAVNATLSSTHGLIHVPVRDLFNLPVTVVDLWHEAAAALYFWRYRYTQIQPEPNLSEQQRRNLYSDLADHYADLLVFTVGFRDDLHAFIASLVGAWVRSHRASVSPPAAVAVSLRKLLLRLYTVTEFGTRRTMKSPFHNEFAPVLVLALRDYLHSTFVSREGFEPLAPSTDMWVDVYENVLEDTYERHHRRLMRQLAHVPSPPNANQDAGMFFDGVIRSFSDATDMNAVFGGMAKLLQDPTRVRGKDFSAFKAMAALAKSATLEYLARQMCAPPPVATPRVAPPA